MNRIDPTETQQEAFPISIEDDDGGIIHPPNQTCFAVRHIPKRGDQLEYDGKYYVVTDIIHTLFDSQPASISVRVKLRNSGSD